MQQALPNKQMTASPEHGIRKKWIKSQQNWSWVFTVSWMIAAQFWPVFGLLGFVCMFASIVLAATGWGKMK